jgi:hypothetical protein
MATTSKVPDKSLPQEDVDPSQNTRTIIKSQHKTAQHINRAHSKARAHEYCTALDESSKKLGLLDDFQMATTNKACRCFLVPDKGSSISTLIHKNVHWPVRSRATTFIGLIRTSSGLLSKFPVRSVQ